MSQQDVEIVRRDFERFLQTGELRFEGLDPQIEIHDHDIPDADVYRGHEGFVKWISYWSEPWEEFGLEPERFVDAGVDYYSSQAEALEAVGLPEKPHG